MVQPRKTSITKAAEGNRAKLGKGRIKTDPRGNGRPQIPEGLIGEAAELWAITVASLPDGILSSADEGLLEAYARAWARYRYAARLVVKAGYFGPRGLTPAFRLQEQACGEMYKLAGVLGLSPAARARLTDANQVGQEDPLALLLGEDMDPDGAWRDPAKKAN